MREAESLREDKPTRYRSTFSRRSLLFRLYRVVQEIQKDTYPGVSQLAEILEVSKRTVNRYIEMLRDDFDAPIVYDRGRGGYYFEESWSMPFPNLTEGETLALLIFLDVIEQFKGTPLEEAFNRLGEKLKLALPDSLKISYEDFEMLLSPFLVPLTMRVDVSKVFGELFRAITDRKRALISYYSFSSRQVTERKVDPYHIYNFEGVWYFCGFCHLREEIRDFALDRVQEVKVLEESFARPPDFSPQEYLNRAFRMYRGEATQIRIRFDSYQSAWIKERIWHPAQEIEELPDGGIIFTIYGHPEEIKRWVIGYGAHAEILEPQYLRKEIAEEIEKLQRIYHNDRK